MRTTKTIVLSAILIFFSAGVLSSCSQETASTPKPPLTAKTAAELDTTGKTPLEVAQFVFDNYDCKSCHVLGTDGKFGYSARGEQIRQGSEGCVSLLTAMNVIAHAKEEDRTAEQKVKAAHFQEYGCVMCHQVSPGSLNLTEAGQKLASLHLSCSEVQRILNQKAGTKAL